MSAGVLLSPVVGSLFLFVFGIFYTLPTLLAIADAYGRPPHAWRKPAARTVWIALLTVSYAGALFGIAQAVAGAYAMTVPRRVASAEATAGAREARRRAIDGFLIAGVVFGAAFVLALPNGSNDVMFSIIGTSVVLLATGLTPVVFAGVPSPPLRRVRLTLALTGVGLLAGWVVHYGAVTTCWDASLRCRDPGALWIPAAHAAGGAVAAWWATSRKAPTVQPA